MEDWLSQILSQVQRYIVTNCLHHHKSCGGWYAYSTHKDWKDAAIVTIDAIGEKQTATISTWEDGKRILLRHEVNFPNSLGLFYSAVTSAVGLKSWKMNIS